MESNTGPDDLRALLRVAERAAAAPYVDYPPTPFWYPPAVGAWAAVLAGVVAYRPEPQTSVPILVLLLGLLGGFVSWYTRKRGTMPSMKDAPPEFRRAFKRYWTGLIVLAAIVVPLVLFAPHLLAVVVTFALVTAGIALYEREYARAAEATRARLG